MTHFVRLLDQIFLHDCGRATNGFIFGGFCPQYLKLDVQAGSLFMRIRELSPSCQPASLIETHSNTLNGCHVGVPLVETKCRLTSFIFLHDC